jgi:hypothetical protein
MENKTQLRRERQIKDIAVSCIPEDKLYDFEMRCPLGQPQLAGSSSPLVSITLSEADLGKTHHDLKVESVDLP